MTLSDSERAEMKLRAVSVDSTDHGDEYHEVGQNGVTAIKWGWTSGHMAALQTIAVYKGEHLYSEHCFSNVLGVYYAEESTP